MTIKISKEAAIKIPRAVGLVLILHFGLQALSKIPDAEPESPVKIEMPTPSVPPSFVEYRNHE